jgi:hypothetical protein
MLEIMMTLAGALSGGGLVAWLRREPGDSLLRAIVRPFGGGGGPKPTR